MESGLALFPPHPNPSYYSPLDLLNLCLWKPRRSVGWYLGLLQGQPCCFIEVGCQLMYKKVKMWLREKWVYKRSQKNRFLKDTHCALKRKL